VCFEQSHELFDIFTEITIFMSNHIHFDIYNIKKHDKAANVYK
jgi:hypothetical protein